MKKKIALVAVIVALCSIFASGTVAYFTADNVAHNIIVSGNVDIEIEETMISDSGEILPFPQEGITGAMPGTSVSKIVAVKNVGSASAWVRVRTEISVVGSDGEVLPVLLQEGSPVAEFSCLEGWTLGEDGYYYCTLPVNVNENTPDFIREVSFSPSMGNEYQDCTFYLAVYAEAVQSANNGASVTEALGWPELNEDQWRDAK